MTRQTGYNYDAHQALTTLTQTVGDVTTVLNYRYDNNGALVAQQSTEKNQNRDYHYNSFGRLGSVTRGTDTVARYHYDPDGRRVSKTVGGKTRYFLYDDTGRGLVGEYGETGALIRGYVYSLGSAYTSDPVALKTPVKIAGQPTGYDYSYYQNDHLGTPQRLMQKSGVTVWQGEYYAFGAVHEVVSHVRNPLRFVGQY